MSDLCTAPELASYLQRDLDTATANLAIAVGSAIVRRYARRHFTTNTWTGVTLAVQWSPRSGYFVALPQRPVVSVASILVNGTAVVWTLDQLNARAVLTGWLPSPLVQGVADQAVVTYTSGASSPPDDVKGVALSVAGRQYDNPTGLRAESIDDYSGTHAGADDDLAGLSLLAGERHILDAYRRRSASVRFR